MSLQVRIAESTQEKKLAEQAEAQKQQRVSEMVSPTAGFKLSDFVKGQQ